MMLKGHDYRLNTLNFSKIASIQSSFFCFNSLLMGIYL